MNTVHWKRDFPELRNSIQRSGGNYSARSRLIKMTFRDAEQQPGTTA
jgi:hypothetical protein